MMDNELLIIRNKLAKYKQWDLPPVQMVRDLSVNCLLLFTLSPFSLFTTVFDSIVAVFASSFCFHWLVLYLAEANEHIGQTCKFDNAIYTSI